MNPKGIEGLKKPQLQIIPTEFSVQVANALMFGASKYGHWNWRGSKVEIMTYLGAMKRHIDAVIDGEDIDPESGCHHLGHVAANCAIVIDAQKCSMMIDNRPPEPASIYDQRPTNP